MKFPWLRWVRRVFLPIVVRAVRASRLQGLAVLALCWILSFGQGQELALSLQVGEFLSIVVGLTAVLVLATTIWIWTSVAIVEAPIMRHNAAPGRSKARRFKRQIHNILSTAYALTLQIFVIYELVRIGEKGAAVALASLNAVILFLLIQALQRKPVGNRFEALRARLSLISPASAPQIVWTLIASLVLMALWTIWREQWTQILGAFGTTFLSLAIALSWLSLIVLLLRFRKVPLLVTVLLLAPFVAETIYGRLGIKFDRYAVRTLVNSRGSEPGQRMDPADTATKWRAQADALGPNTPIVFVTAAGGGIRAAYWTAAVLGRLADCVHNFPQKVFSLSGVSGGSLGAAAFVTLIDQRPPGPPIPCQHNLPWDAPVAGMGENQLFLRDALSDDFLAPVIREMILGDGYRALLPFKVSNSDRAVALEQAWENAWKKSCDKWLKHACANRALLSSSFTRRDRQAPFLPALVLNGVHQESGKRLVTSTIQFAAGELVDTIDFFKLVEHDVRISTAVSNSARFPIVSPSGALVRHADDKLTRLGHVIDGGYFDNNGTLTSHEIAARVLPLVGNVGSPDTCSSTNRRVVFLEILNDNTMPEYDTARNARDFVSAEIESNAAAAGGFDANLPAQQLLTAVQGLATTRGARAVHASKALAKFSENNTCNKRFVQINLCPGMIPNPPLGWTLSRESRQAMDSLIIGHGERVNLYQSSEMSRIQECYAGIQSRLDELIRFLR